MPPGSSRPSPGGSAAAPSSTTHQIDDPELAARDRVVSTPSQARYRTNEKGSRKPKSGPPVEAGETDRLGLCPRFHRLSMQVYGA